MEEKQGRSSSAAFAFAFTEDSTDIRIGTSGFHYRHWVGSFYPQGTPAWKMLDYYLRFFNTVEVNNSFYRLPRPGMLSSWREATPPNFLFAVKGSRFVTHNKKLKDPENALENLLPRAEELKEKLGPILFQLPPKWRCNTERLEQFLEALPKSHQYAFEFREASWHCSEVLSVLRRHNAAYCIYELAGFATENEVTADWSYIRLHGPGGKYQGSYSDRTLRSWAALIRSWEEKLDAVYVYFDNDQAGYAAENAIRLKRFIAQTPHATKPAGLGDRVASRLTSPGIPSQNGGDVMAGKTNRSKAETKPVQGKSANVRQFPQSSARREGDRPKPPFPKQKQQRPGMEADIEPRPSYQAANYHPADKLKGKVALITGGDSGIGRAVAVLYAKEGADIAIVYLAQEQRDADETRRAIEQEGRTCLLIPGDVTDPNFCRKAVERATEEFGHLDILVNNAAFQQHQQSPEDVSDEQWDHTFKTNIYGYFRMAKAALKHLPRGGVIINTGSETGLEGNKQLLDYSATKGAIHAFTKSLAQMLVERGIRVNCVAPGPVWTPLNVADKEPDKVAEHGKKTPMQRPAQPEEIAPAYVFFASDADSSYITGEVLTLLGGQTMAA
jgi:NAD(P)-dependent dehydrogenase (short-subunit alcohol dehydrogenase family)/uncharacterized protein YecE (DUF72 family)